MSTLAVTSPPASKSANSVSLDPRVEPLPGDDRVARVSDLNVGFAHGDLYRRYNATSGEFISVNPHLTASLDARLREHTQYTGAQLTVSMFVDKKNSTAAIFLSPRAGHENLVGKSIVEFVPHLHALAAEHAEAAAFPQNASREFRMPPFHYAVAIDRILPADLKSQKAALVAPSAAERLPEPSLSLPPVIRGGRLLDVTSHPQTDQPSWVPAGFRKLL